MIHEWDLTQTNLRRLREGRFPNVAVICTSAIEPHNLHLPYGDDFLHTGIIARRVCERAWNAGANVVLLPGIPYGVDCNLMDFPLAMHVSQNTLNAMLRDLFESLKANGIKRIVVLNGHGGNDFTAFVRQVQSDLGIAVFVCDWWKVGSDKWSEIFEHRDDHAGELETSVSLALFPELVELEHALDGAVKPFRFEALRKGWVRTSRRFAQLNDHCAAGDPRKATVEKGHRYLEVVQDRLTEFLVELAKAKDDAAFPMESR